MASLEFLSSASVNVVEVSPPLRYQRDRDRLCDGVAPDGRSVGQTPLAVTVRCATVEAGVATRRGVGGRMWAAVRRKGRGLCGCLEQLCGGEGGGE